MSHTAVLTVPAPPSMSIAELPVPATPGTPVRHHEAEPTAGSAAAAPGAAIHLPGPTERRGV